MQGMDFSEMTVSSILNVIELETFIAEDIQLPPVRVMREPRYLQKISEHTFVVRRDIGGLSRELNLAHLEKDLSNLSNLKDSGRKQQFIKGCRSCTEKGKQKCADNVDDFSTSSNFLQEIASLLSVPASTESTQVHGQETGCLVKKYLEIEFSSNQETQTRSKFEDRVSSAIRISLERWVDYLKVHTMNCSYEDLLEVHLIANGFLKRVEFYFLSLVDLQMKSSQICKDIHVDFRQGVSFPPLATLHFDASIENPRPQSLSLQQGKSHSDTRNTKSELEAVRWWLKDAINYFETQRITAFYEEFRMVRDTARNLVELLKLFLRDHVDRMLEKLFPVTE